MPVIQINWWEGRTKEQKAKLAKRITEVVSEVAGIPPEATHIVFNDVNKDDWAIGGRLSSEE